MKSQLKWKKIEKEIIKEFIEKGADLEHKRWARWQNWVHQTSHTNIDGSITIPAELVKRWKRQIDTPYSKLSEKEKESDRKETRNYIPLLKKILKSYEPSKNN